ncbi:conserved hypothetical protein [Pirellula staleyi DSM 6068]|uniref:AAA ATPase n=1 Tax=Pirellula staleyi (strain ATCC 27377 / DSM 6068 / ICPB 4128) TaxID=530564 RepID=D2R5L7_PIRSD|nr:hypothetical protein [Pirellula staleyi]ADB17199.1 conserved hypothetical protein [Pirellula staleyi DSM 6068]
MTVLPYAEKPVDFVIPEPIVGEVLAFTPPEPKSLEETGLAAQEVEALLLKHLLTGGSSTGRRMADVLKLPFGIVHELLRGVKAQLLVNYKSQAQMGDFEYELTPEGEARARYHSDRCTYCGAAPVTLSAYIDSVLKQSVRRVRPKLSDLCQAFSDLSMAPAMISQIGQAVHAGRGMFIYGSPGNGKTSIAERVIRAVSQHVWVPRTITVSGEIIRVFDPANHEEAPLAAGSAILSDSNFDRRWVRIRRPSIIVGGELRMEHLELTSNPATGIIEAPVQLKSNCGALVVDDFGRQRMTTTELLNRWIIPLEKGYDFLSLPSGRQIQVPFDQLMVFSTNLEPHKLVDEAFLRRIPYKLEVSDPTPREFKELVKQWCAKLGLEYSEEALQHWLEEHYKKPGRAMRYCHPRDLVNQVKTFCEFHDLPMVLTSKGVDVAARNYFAGL